MKATFNPQRALAAKRALAERLTNIALLYVPEGYRIAYRKSLSGRCDMDKKLIQAPKPITRKALYIFLHECGHANLHDGKRLKRHVEEMQAEQFAHEKMREHGIAIPRAMTKRAKQYVTRKITQAQRRGAKRIDPTAKKFASS